MRGVGHCPWAERLRAFLGERHLLLLLDNFEQVDEAASLVVELLAACSNLQILVTSRGTLRVCGERLFPVPPLALVHPEKAASAVDILQSDAIRLFVDRAQAVDPDFVLTPETAKAVAEICRRLDGLPLAIELAAAWVKVLRPEAMLLRLARALPLLTGGARDAPARQQTLSAAIAWGYDLLSPGEQELFRRLAVFVGGCRLEGAEEVSRGVDESGSRADGGLDRESSPRPLGSSTSVLDGIASLIDRSLVRQETVDGEARWRAHARYYLALAETAEPELTGQEQIAWLDRLEADRHNLRAALT